MGEVLVIMAVVRLLLACLPACFCAGGKKKNDGKKQEDNCVWNINCKCCPIYTQNGHGDKVPPKGGVKKDCRKGDNGGGSGRKKEVGGDGGRKAKDSRKGDNGGGSGGKKEGSGDGGRRAKDCRKGDNGGGSSGKKEGSGDGGRRAGGRRRKD